MVATAYGPPEVFRLAEVPTPEPAAGEIRVRVHAATVTAGDGEIRSFRLPWWLWLPVRALVGWRRPRRGILGQELAGVVDAVGAGVTRFAPGDAVFAQTGPTMGAYAEYIRLREHGPVARKPAALSFGEAAALPVGGLNALHFLGRAGVRAGERVLIVGAGGSIGTMAVQLAKRAGAGVVAVDGPEKLAMLRELGADRVVDYTREAVPPAGERFDVIFEVVGAPLGRSLRALAPGGRFVSANPSPSLWLRGLWARWTGGRPVITGLAEETAAALERLAALAAAGELRVVIDRRYPLREVAAAHRYVDGGGKKGCVVLDVVAADAGG